MWTPPRLLNKVFALASGEVDASALEAYRRAGHILYELQMEAELDRLNLQQAESPSNSAARHRQISLLCLWNAYVLQTCGDQLLEADYRLNSLTRGFLPRPTAVRALDYYQQVEGWISRAQQARHNPQFSVDLKQLPAKLPHQSFPNLPKARHEHNVRYIEGMLTALSLLRARCNTLLENFVREQANESAVQRLQQLLAKAHISLEYAIRLWSHPQNDMYPKVGKNLDETLACYFLFGQLVAMPELIDTWPRHPQQPGHQTASHPPTNQPLPVEGSAADQASALPADLWCLSDAAAQAQTLYSHRTAMLAAMWRADPRPDVTLAINKRLAEALAKGEIDYALDASGQRLPYFKQCPWSPVYVSKRPLMIGGDPLRANQRFAYVCDVDKTETEMPTSFGNRILRL